MTNWNLSVTGDSTAITQAETVTFSGQGNVIASRSGNFVIITGVDQDLSSYATTSFVNSVSGNLQSEIDSNDTDISALQTATGLLETRVTQNETDITSLETATGNLDTRVTQNESDINSVSGLLYNNWNINVTGNVDSITSNETVLFTGIGNTSVTYDSSSNIVSISGADQDLSSYATTAYVNSVSGNLQGEIDSNDTDISALQTATGLLETRVTQNETDITTLETATGLLEVRVTQNETDITALETATGNLDTRVTQNTNDISSVSGLLYNNWNINVTGNIDSITSNETVLFTGVGNTSVTYNSSTNTVSISGTDQDLSSYATTAYVNSVSGNLQGEIDSNDTDIANLQTATGNLDTRVSQNETDITALETATGNLDTRVTQNTSDITSVSGLLYNNWKINVTGNIDDITSEQTVIFTGINGTDVTYNSSTNTVSISASGGGGMTSWNVGVTGASDAITDGQTVTFTGLGATSVTYNDSTNTVSISGAAGSYSWNVGVTGASDTINNGNTVTFTGAGQSNVTYNPSTNTVLISGVNGSAPTGNHSGVAYFGSNNLITENTDFTISDSGKVYSKVSFGSLDNQGNKSGTITFNAESSNLHLATLTGNSTLAITGEDIGQKILIRLQQDSVGGYIVNWWNNIKWAEGGTPPTLTTASGKADMFGFIVTSGNGPYFYDGFIIGQNI
jgi:predicted  nucleic acid-binding Zn-ribbon protein